MLSDGRKWFLCCGTLITYVLVQRFVIFQLFGFVDLGVIFWFFS